MTQNTPCGRSDRDDQFPSRSQASTVYAEWTNSETPAKPPIAQQPMAMLRVAQASRRVYSAVSGK